ncbi:MAG: inorganic phosphate transporter [Flavobacteriales bacterium]
MMIILFIVALMLAYSNGANDNFKGVATLFGSKTTSYKNAINWATITTFSGSVTAIFLAGELVKNFSGKGLVPDELLQTSPEFAISIALGAAITVFLATKIGMPISTTHSLVGGLFGAGVIAVGSGFDFGKLIDKFLFPLIASPLMAAVVALVVYFIFTQLRKKSNIKKTVPSENETVADEKYLGETFGVKNQKILDVLHFLSSGIVSFARGLNDTPKIVGLLLIINHLDIRIGMISVAVAMAIGGLLNAKKVGKLISEKITPMNSGQGFTANLITGLLVTTASVHGMPVSTTHVSIGSIFGIGTITRKANFGVVKKILVSWVLTLPIAAIFSGLVYFLLSTLS